MTTSQTALPDTQRSPETRGVSLNNAGIRDLLHPLKIIDVDGTAQLTVASIDLSVGVHANQRGTHMSRLVEFAHGPLTDLELGATRALTDVLAGVLDASSATIDLRFPWFVSRQAPVSGRDSKTDVNVRIRTSMGWADSLDETILEVAAPVTTLCPCSKAISKYGAHNQRSIVTVRIRCSDVPPPIDRIVSIIEASGSCPVYAVLKREDEKHVTEKAYDNPKFAEDLVRDLWTRLTEELSFQSAWVQTVNHESIHNHSAYASTGDQSLSL